MRAARWGRAALLLLVLTTLLTGRAALATPVAKGGLIDLDFAGATAAVHALRGEWAFAWQQFLAPETATPPPGQATVPGSWNTVAGKPRGTDGYATYSLRVQCPAGEQMALAVPPQRTAMVLYVNGVAASVQGQPATSAEHARPAIGRRLLLTEPFPCPLRITAHVSNFSHRAGGMVRVPLAGPPEVLASMVQQRLALETIALSAFLVLGVTGVIFHASRRKDTAPLLVGLFCLLQAVYADMLGERLLLQLWGPETPWEAYLRIEYLAFYGALAVFPLMVDRLFPRLLHPGVARATLALCALAALVVALAPARIHSHLVVAVQALGGALFVYTVVRLAQALRQGRPDAGVLLGGLVLLLAAATVAQLQVLHGTSPGLAILLGQLAFVLSAPLVLVQRLARLLAAEERRTSEQREKADLLVRTTGAGIFDWDASRNLFRYSPRLLEILGYPQDTDVSQWTSFFHHIHPADHDNTYAGFIEQLRDRSVRNGELRHDAHECRLVRADGSPVWVHIEAISLRNREGRAMRYICSVLDITEQRAVAEGLQRQNAALAENARLREDVERMSRHDLKTPLNSIIGVARLLREDPNLPAEQRELLAISERAGYRMLEMVNLSLDLSRMELGTYEFRPQAVNLVDVVSRVLLDLDVLAATAEVEVALQHSFGGPVYARAEELLCYSLLANVLKNAVEATPPGGTVRIGIEPGDPVRLWVRNPARVPAPVAGRFFDKYVTAGKAGGMGLGTYSARLMARVQEGDLAMSTGDDGTLLTLTLRPLGAEQLPAPTLPGARPVAPGAAAGVADFPPRRVLVADDDEYNRLLLLRYLPSPPFTVESAANGAAALQAVARHWPDIVLIDMEMPVMNGLEAVAALRERERQAGRAPCLVLMMSSNDDPGSIRRGLAAGSNRYLTKPFTREALLAVLRELDTGAPPPTQPPPDDEPAPEALARPDAPVRVDGELLGEVPAFLASRQQMAAAMEEALAAGARERLRALAHRAAGGLALFGFQWAAWQSRQISLQAQDGEPAELAGLIEGLRAHLRDVEVE